MQCKDATTRHIIDSLARQGLRVDAMEYQGQMNDADVYLIGSAANLADRIIAAMNNQSPPEGFTGYLRIWNAEHATFDIVASCTHGCQTFGTFDGDSWSIVYPKFTIGAN
jgi:hypothetical protein